MYMSILNRLFGDDGTDESCCDVRIEEIEPDSDEDEA